MYILVKLTNMLTNDMPQCEDIVIARGRHTERSRLLTASVVKIRMKWFDDIPDKVKCGCQCPFAS